MTHDEWVAAALDAAVQQVGQVAVEDDDALDVIAEELARAEPHRPGGRFAGYSTRNTDPQND
jgi:hypothetical protein